MQSSITVAHDRLNNIPSEGNTGYQSLYHRYGRPVNEVLRQPHSKEEYLAAVAHGVAPPRLPTPAGVVATTRGKNVLKKNYRPQTAQIVDHKRSVLGRRNDREVDPVVFYLNGGDEEEELARASQSLGLIGTLADRWLKSGKENQRDLLAAIYREKAKSVTY